MNYVVSKGFQIIIIAFCHVIGEEFCICSGYRIEWASKNLVLRGYDGMIALISVTRIFKEGVN